MPDGCAREVVRLAAAAGIALTPAGATHPGGLDPRDAFIRIAPTYPPVADLEQAIAGLAVCVRLAGRGYGKLTTPLGTPRVTSRRWPGPGPRLASRSPGSRTRRG